MSLYSTDLRSQIIDPQTDITNQKTEWRFAPNTAYYPNLRLTNLGAKGAGSHHYNRGAGVSAVIKHIRLLDGGVEIDAVRFANRYMSFVNTNAPNEVNLCVGSLQQKHSIGYEIQPADHYVSPPAWNNKKQTDVDNDEPNLGHLDLRRLLPILNVIPVLDTSVFKNLSVVVEYETDASKIVVVDNQPQTIQTPLLIADEIIDQQVRAKLNSQNKGVVWNKIDHDAVNVPAIANPAGAGDKTDQNVNLQINGFDNKYVSRVLMAKTTQDSANACIVSGNNVRGKGHFCSLAMHKEKINFRLNGRNIFGGSGITQQNTKASLLYDTFGKVNLKPYENYTCIGFDRPDDAGVNQSSVPALTAGFKPTGDIGNADYVGLSLNEKVSQLFIDYSRTATNTNFANDQHQQALTIHFYAECRKALTFNKNGIGYNVSYV